VEAGMLAKMGALEGVFLVAVMATIYKRRQISFSTQAVAPWGAKRNLVVTEPMHGSDGKRGTFKVTVADNNGMVASYKGRQDVCMPAPSFDPNEERRQDLDCLQE
jgi:hypothetical protein